MNKSKSGKNQVCLKDIQFTNIPIIYAVHVIISPNRKNNLTCIIHVYKINKHDFGVKSQKTNNDVIFVR